MRILRVSAFTRHRSRAAIIAVLDIALVLGVGAYLAGGLAVGASADSDPVRLLGTKLVDASCPSMPLAVGKGATIVCPTWTAITSAAGVVQVVSLYGPGNAVVAAFGGALPLGLHWGEELGAVWDSLGRPSRVTGIYGTPTLVYMFVAQRFGSLELRFDVDDHLTRVNALLTR